MKQELKSQCNSANKQSSPEHNKERCPRCGNEYVVVWLKEAENYNDFGDRFCPFCGLMTEAFCILAMA
jgi:transcription elongation factor Elf1